MRNLLRGGLLTCLIIGVHARGAVAQHHENDQTSHKTEDKDANSGTKKRPGGPKPENQPGATMNAEELAASHADHHAMTTYEDGGILPQGWRHRFDLSDMKVENLRFVTTGTGLHVTSGPPGIYYEPTLTASGSYSVTATFTQLSKGEHMEGYGPFVGGADLENEGQRYTYFLLRQDGRYLIKQRVGVNTKGVMDWTGHPAIKSFDADGKMTNTLTVAVDKDSVRFLINGTEVDRKPRNEVDTDGIVGLRVNHNLDLMIDGFGVATAPIQ